MAEAHFVERNDSGELVDGWPIGYYDYEFPQHKTTQDRVQMARIASTKLACMRAADVVVLDSVEGINNNPFLNHFGAWPDQAFCVDVDTEKLLFRGQVSLILRFKD